MSGKTTVGKFGTLLVKVVETRDFKSAYCTINCDVVNRAGVAKKKNEMNAKYDETFTLFVIRFYLSLTFFFMLFFSPLV